MKNHRITDVKIVHADGFSLVELAVVLLIIGLLMSAGVKFLTVQAESSAYSATKVKQSTLKAALVSYFRKYHRLPCPDNKPNGGNTGSFSTTTPPDGIENRNGTNTTPDTSLACVSNFGVIPYQTLNLSREAALDGWENMMSYRVYYPSSGLTNDWTKTSSFAADNVGAISVLDRYPATSTTTTTLTSTAVIVIISHGKNGLGAFTTDGTQNVLPDSTFDEYFNTIGSSSHFKREISLDTSNTTYGTYDDLLTFLSADDLLSELVQDGSITPPTVELKIDMENISTKVLGSVLSNNNCTTPTSLANAGVTGDILIDPWGTPYVYTEGLSEIQSDGDAKDNAGNNVTESTYTAYSITSAGPDRDISTTADNIAQNHTAAELIGAMGGAFINNNCP